MIFRRRGFTHRLTAMVLAFAMPMCCCVVNGFAGGRCCGDKAAQAATCENAPTPSCCQTRQAASVPVDESEPCDKAGACTCCIKVPGPVFEWAVPVDHLGTLIVDLSFDISAVADAAPTTFARPPGWNPPPPPWQRIAAGCGCTILHC